jgi:hypothetical protein
MERLVRLGYVAPRCAAPAARRHELAERRVHALRQSAVAALQRDASRLDLERDPELREPAHVLRARLLTRAPRFGSICTMPSPWRVRSAERSECRATSYSPPSTSSRRGVPGFSSPARMRSRSESASASTLSAAVGTGYSIRPWRMPIATAWVRVDASSFARMRFVCVRTVSVERPSFSATASVCIPSASI